jgi:hypothetical protein
MAERVADSFKGLPMGDLIGGPLMAACDAQVRMANATADFIKVVGFLPPTEKGKDYGAVRTATFKFTRPTGGAPREDGSSPTEDVTLDVPLLAIVKVPSLSIKTVDVTFDMEVKSSETSKESLSAEASVSAEVSGGWGPVSAKVSIAGSVASHKENTRTSDQSAKYHVAIHASDDGMPEGLARVLDIMNSAIAPKTVTATPAAAA